MGGTKKRGASSAETPAEAPSRSAKKRESAALQRLGEELANLAPEERAAIPLGDELAQALNFYDTLRDHESRRRQRQFIGKLMRGLDPGPIVAALASRHAAKSRDTSALRMAGVWREKLLAAEGPKLDKLLDEITGENQQEREIVAEKIASARQDNAKGPFRELFRILAEIAKRRQE